MFHSNNIRECRELLVLTKSVSFLTLHLHAHPMVDRNVCVSDLIMSQGGSCFAAVMNFPSMYIALLDKGWVHVNAAHPTGMCLSPQSLRVQS